MKFFDKDSNDKDNSKEKTENKKKQKNDEKAEATKIDEEDFKKN